ncbi:MAG TPA: hypothetical protein VLT45_18340 [Kofleriaceae bacterium]|nr:hypothetical protein [Kofleriaceae bacterium]
MTIPRALLLALALMQAIGLVDYMRRAECEEECKRDGCDDTGPCDGSSCACHCPCAASSIVAAPHAITVDVTPPAPSAAAVFVHTDDLRASPDPREILHVPRAHAV